MKKLLLALTILTSTKSLHSMEIPSPNTDYSKLSPITLPQIYHHLSEILLPDISFHIFSLQPGTDALSNKVIHKKASKDYCVVAAFTTYTHITHRYCGHCLTVEHLKKDLLHSNLSICDISDDYGKTVLHSTACNGYTKDAILFLEVAGNKAWTLLTAQINKQTPWTGMADQTALHFAAECGHVEFAKLLLDTAGDNAQNLINVRDNQGRTAFDIATPEVKEIMLKYVQNNQ